MSQSRNFTARAKPSFEGSELSRAKPSQAEPNRAKLGHFNFRAESKLTFYNHFWSFFANYTNIFHKIQILVVIFPTFLLSEVFK